MLAAKFGSSVLSPYHPDNARDWFADFGEPFVGRPYPLATSMRISRSGSSRESTATLSMRTKLSYSSSQPAQDILARIRRGRRFDVPVPRGTVRLKQVNDYASSKWVNELQAV